MKDSSSSKLQETDEASVYCHFGASTIAAVINFPLWRAAAIQQSGFKLSGSNFMIRYYRAVTTPPFKGLSNLIESYTPTPRNLT